MLLYPISITKNPRITTELVREMMSEQGYLKKK